MRTRPRPTRTILEPRDTLLAISTPPLVRRLARDVHRLGRNRDRPTILDPVTQPEPTFRREWSVTVHNGLPGCVCCLRQLHTDPGGHYSARINNVPRHNN